MKNYTNIEKSAFRPGEYVGYSNGVWHITKSNSVYGRWCARKRDEPNQQFFAWSLQSLSEKLTAREKKGGD